MGIKGTIGAEQYAKIAGSILANLLSHEIQLRWFMCHVHDEEFFPQMHVGTEVDETHFTNWMQLSDLIKAYNKQLKRDEQQFLLDMKPSDIRGALVHGRVFTDSPEPAPFKLHRFSSPMNGKVRVESIRSITEDEMEPDVRHIEQQFRLVAECAKRRGYFDSTHVGR